MNAPLGPEACYEQAEAISPDLHDRTAAPARHNVDSVNSALKHARTGLQRRLPPPGEHESPPAPDSPAEQALVAKFVRAYQSGDVDPLVALLTADVSMSIPPMPLEWQGRDVVALLRRRLLHGRDVYWVSQAPR
jgi:hypothetical protein